MRKEKVNNLISLAQFSALIRYTQWISFGTLIYRKCLFKSVANKKESFTASFTFKSFAFGMDIGCNVFWLIQKKGMSLLKKKEVYVSVCSDTLMLWMEEITWNRCSNAHTFDVIHAIWPVSLYIYSIQRPYMLQISITELCIHAITRKR